MVQTKAVEIDHTCVTMASTPWAIMVIFAASLGNVAKPDASWSWWGFEGEQSGDEDSPREATSTTAPWGLYVLDQFALLVFVDFWTGVAWGH